jgi:uncharacterized protein
MRLSRIMVYPIKSLDGVVMKTARITDGGILEFDRVYAIVDEAGAFVNAKRTPHIQLLRTTFDSLFQEVEIGENGSMTRSRFNLAEPEPFNQWLSNYFGFPVKLMSETKKGFPDDRTAFGPTVTSEASLRTVTEWFPDMELDNARRRFRSNLEIADVTAFWEDHLFGEANQLKSFQIGEVNFLGHNPCQRCVVPTRDPERGTVLPQFQKSFMELRKRNLPSWSNATRFNHYYRFAINTSILESEAGKVLHEGDMITIH